MALDPRLQASFTAVPVHGSQQHSRQGLDPRLARKILRTTDLAPEERVMLQTYIAQSRWVPAERQIYSAVLDGFDTIPELAGVTGLSEAECSKTINKLAKKGMIRRVASSKS